MNLLNAYWSEIDPLWLFFAGLITLVIIYYIIQWTRSTRNYRESADDHAKGCLETISWGCMIPISVIVLAATILLH